MENNHQDDHDHFSTSIRTSPYDPPAEMVQELMKMGFPREWCITALRKKQNDMVDDASTHVFIILLSTCSNKRNNTWMPQLHHDINL